MSTIIMGEKRSGKGKMMDRIIDLLYQDGFFIFWMFSALGFENLFTIINKDCKKRCDLFFKENPDQRGKVISACNCHGIIPIIAMVPDYIELDQKTVDKFNRLYWKNLEEYRQYFTEISSEDKQKLLKGELKKPKEFQPDPRKVPVKFMHFTPPTSKSLHQIFRKQLRDMTQVCKEEHRILVFSPAFVHSKKDKYDTVAQGLRYIQEELCIDPLFDNIKREKDKKYSKWELSNNKIAIILNEARSTFPAHKLSGDTEAGESKRAGYNFLPERRHAKSWVFIDVQSPIDIFDGIRNQ